jgi:hypothetical protein
MSTRALLLALPLVLAPAAVAQTDAFHLMQIELIVGGVNGDPSKQIIQLRQRFAFQNFVAGHSVYAYDASGANRITLVTFPGNVPNGDDGDRILIASPGWTPPVEPDFVMSAPIPAAYLAAGRVTFGNEFETLWSLAYGGSSYTGATTGGITNDADGEFGPPWAGPLPTDSRGLLFQGPASALSTSNNLDYALTPGPATITNNARASAALPGGPAPCYANCDGSTVAPVLNVGDFTCFLQRFAAGESYANCDASTVAPVLNVGDFTCFLQRFAAGCP